MPVPSPRRELQLENLGGDGFANIPDQVSIKGEVQICRFVMFANLVSGEDHVGNDGRKFEGTQVRPHRYRPLGFLATWASSDSTGHLLQFRFDFDSAPVERLDPRDQGPSVEVDRVDVGPTTALASFVGLVFV